MNKEEDKMGLVESLFITFANLLQNKFPYNKFSFLVSKLEWLFCATCTVQENRTDHFPVENSGEMKKKCQGIYDR